MNIWIIIGIFGISFTSIQLFPQIYKSIKTGKTRDLSLGLCLVVGLGALTWLIYGIHLSDAPIIIANSLNFIGAIILLILKIRQ